MITAGIDLGSQPDRTAACVIEWRDGRAHVVELCGGVDDDLIVSLIRRSDWTGIDVPLGWPDGFIAAVSAHHAAADWAGGELAQLRMRATDEWVHGRTGRWPLSVSTDRIAVPALRAARVLSRLPEARDRGGGGPVVEVYPAAALRIWGFESRSYKRMAGAAARSALVTAFHAATEGWLVLGEDNWRQCAARGLDRFAAPRQPRSPRRRYGYDGRILGGMPEWLIGAVLKTARAAKPSGVRIPLPPPNWLYPEGFWSFVRIGSGDRPRRPLGRGGGGTRAHKELNQ